MRGVVRFSMQTDAPIDALVHVVQISVAPVFLLTGIASLLVVLTNRLGRIIDRARLLEDHHFSATAESRIVLVDDLRILSHRARMANLGISLLTLAALLVCILIAGIFISAFFDRDVSLAIATLFVLAMFALIAGLLCFLREVQLATASLRIGPR